MAVNKAQTSLGMKIVLIVLIVAFVLSFVSIGSGLFSGNNNPNAPTANDPVSAANAKYQPTVSALTGQLQSQPESYTVLVGLGNTYFDWANEVQQASRTSTAAVGADQPLWVASKDAYERAVKIKKEDPVVVDYAITLFYTGETNEAIKQVEAVMKKSPKFAPAFFNAGVFYGASGQTSKAISAFEQAVKLDPQGKQSNVDFAKQQIQQLKSSPSTTTP